MKNLLTLSLFTGFLCLSSAVFGQGDSFKTVTFDSLDGLKVTADLYQPGQDASRPMIVLCHQAGWSRGEYREIAPKLNTMGFNCLAIDQRSGKAVNNVENATAAAATSAGKDTGYVSAEQDMVAAINHVREAGMAEGKVILWGSSYSSALALRIAGQQPELIDGVLSFAPGEYFGSFQKPSDWIASSAKNIAVPAFVTSAKDEYRNWSAIFDAIDQESKVKFLPSSKGNHGSRALWQRFDDNQSYWDAVTPFLQQFLNDGTETTDGSGDKEGSGSGSGSKKN